MVIGINGNEANVEHRVGVGQYAFELLKHLNKLDTPDIQFRIYLADNPRSDMPKAGPGWSYEILPGGAFWTLTTLQFALIKEKIAGNAPDIFLTLTHYTPIFMPLPSVICIMDLAFERFPNFFKPRDLYQLKYWTRISVFGAQKIVTISEFSKKEIISLYHVPADKIEVVYPGFDEERFNDNVSKNDKRNLELKKKYDLEEGYFVYIGTLQPRKNLVRLVEAFASLERKNLKLAVVGMKNEGRGGWMFEAFISKVKELGLSDRVVLTGYVPDEELPYLLSGSLGYILPSLYEGFGIPPIEAMALGVTTIVSNTSSLYEVCGPEAVYIEDPYSIASIKKALAFVLHMKAGEFVRRSESGKKWVNRFSWQKSASKLLKILC